LSIYVSSLLLQREETTRRDSTAFPHHPSLSQREETTRRDSTAFPHHPSLSQEERPPGVTVRHFHPPSLSQEEKPPGVTVRQFYPRCPMRRDGRGRDSTAFLPSRPPPTWPKMLWTNRSDSRPRERWPLLTVELRQMGTYGVQMKEVLPWMVLWARSAPAQEIFILPWLLWSAQ
jgi:hypothetical protein